MKPLQCCVVIGALATSLFAQQLADRTTIKPAPAKTPNSHALYQQLRSIGVGAESSAVSNFELKRDVATFTFKSGTFHFLEPINGKVTGVVFIGDGTVQLEPASRSERFAIRMLAKDGYEERFSSLVLRFTDSTYDDIKKAAPPVAGSVAGNSELSDVKDKLRHTLHYNLDGRILADVLSDRKSGIFWAFINGKTFGDKQIFELDPTGATGFVFAAQGLQLSGFLPVRMGPDEVLLQTYGDNLRGTWLSDHLVAEQMAGSNSGNQPNELIDIDHHDIDVQVDRAGRLEGSDTITLSALEDTAVIPLQLFHKLRIRGVTGQDGQALDFVQEGEKDDFQPYVILSRALSSGETYTFRVDYEGKGAIDNTGGGNYNVNGFARDTWYPNTYAGDFATYGMRIAIPGDMKVAATGSLVSEAKEGGQNVTVWKAESPQPVAGLSIGRFKREDAKLPGYVIAGFANSDPPNWLADINHQAGGDSNIAGGVNSYKGGSFTGGTLSTESLLKRNINEAQVAMQLYDRVYGPVPFKQVAITQQTPCTYGQAWPGLIYLPICSFLDATVRNQFGLSNARGYWDAVTAHEVAHQWWGHAVGWDSYRDQWMSEGFAHFSASLFLQQNYKPEMYRKFWKDEYDILTQKNEIGIAPYQLPVTLGSRVQNTHTGWRIYNDLIYPKGGYILHMVRMMMYDRENGDKAFSAMMQDFVKTYYNKTATTEDFKAIVEKHMFPDMDLDGNKKLDWFFNEYVYGTAMPKYGFEHSITPAGSGQFKLQFKITQSNVDQGFKMLVPVYIELANGTIMKLGQVPITGNADYQTEFVLPLQQAPKRAMINYNFDVLALQ